jgi:tetratricopeptide (TPR) repeat protein
MNSLLELGRTNEARKLLASLPVLKSDLSKLYVNWSHANFHEATGDLGLALESFSAALEIATRLREYATADQMRQATLHTKLLLGLTTDSDDENFLVKGIDSFSEIQDFDSYCLFGCTLALHLYVCGRFDEAKSVILDTIGSLGKMRMRNSGTAYLNALDVLKSLGLDSEALKLLKEASMKLSASDATLSVAHLWNRLSKHATSLRDASISELANSSESRILTRLNSRAS